MATTKAKTTTTALVAPVQSLTVQVAVKEATTLSGQADKIVLKSAEDLAEAMDLLSKIKAAGKRIDDQEDLVLDHYKALTKIEKERWKPSRDKLTTADTALRAAVLVYKAEEAKTLAAKEQKVLAAVETGKLKDTSKAIAKINAIQSTATANTVGAGTFKKIKKLKIEDETKIPRKYLVPDTDAITKVLRAGVPVPGCILEETQSLSVK
jgi:hypothetical protein